MSGMGDGSGAFMMGWMVLWGLVALAIVMLAVAGSVWLIRSGRSGDTRPTVGHHPAAEELLRSRYAAGEIDEDEFRRRLSGLDR